MDSMPERSTRHQPSSLLVGLPQDLRIEIAALVGVTSEHPLADLRSLRGTCLTMCRRPRRRRPVFVDRGDTRWDFLSVEPHRLQSIPCNAERSREFGGLFPPQNQSLLHRCAPPRVGTMWRTIYMPSCSTETMAVPPPTTPQRGTWGGSRAAAVRRPDGWATRGVCLCARRPRVRSTTRLGAFGVNRCRLRHMCAAISRAQAPAAAVAWKRMAFSLFCSEDCRLRCEMVKFAQKIGNQ
jgi:hypothetical protein